MNAKTGDVVFFNREGSRVGIYAGSGYAIAADLEGGYVADHYRLPVKKHGPGVVYVPCPDPQKVVCVQWMGNVNALWTWINGQLGTRYDFEAILLRFIARVLCLFGIAWRLKGIDSAYTDASFVARALMLHRGANPVFLDNRTVSVRDLERFLVA